MKFTDGNWLLREGVQIASPAEVHDLECTNKAITVYAPRRPIQHRGNTLNEPLITVEFSAPMEDVIKVRLSHFAGVQQRGPRFNYRTEEAAAVQVTNGDEFASLKSGDLQVRITKGEGWGIEFLNQNGHLTKSERGSMGYIQVADEGPYMREQLSLGVGEYVYGLGERFTAFVKNGQTVDIWNRDGGTGSEQAYKNIPFYLTNKGYGVFVNHPEMVSFEVGTERVSKVQFSVPGESLEYFIINGPTPKDVLERYTRLMGKPAIPPAWSFGLWLTTSFTTSYDEETVTSFIDGMAERDIPLKVFHFDCFWMKEFHWCDFQWDTRVFPDPEGMLRRLKQKGLKICVWINPYIAQRSPLFAEGMAKGYFLKKPNGDVWQWDLWQAGMAVVDFTNPDACRWYTDKLRALIAMGVDCFKTDFGERIPTDVVYYDGSDPVKMHNYYTYLYNKVVFEMLEEELGKGEAVLFVRSATAGGQQFPVHWGGDCAATYESMAESLRGGLSLGLCGFGFWSHDIGGFENTATPDLYKRWTAFGLLSSHSRLHGSSSYRVPWLFDEEAVRVMRYFTKLKCRLMPYLWSSAQEAGQRGWPVMRAMLLEFPDDPACEQLDRQYMLGDSLLVAPVFAADGRVTYYVPDGTWTDFLTGKTITGGRWVTEQHGYLSLPLLVRPNSLIPIGYRDDSPEYDFADQVVFRLYQLEDGQQASAQILDRQGLVETKLTAARSGRKVTVHTEGGEKPWSLLLMNFDAIANVVGGTTETDEQGIRIIPEANQKKIEIELN